MEHFRDTVATVKKLTTLGLLALGAVAQNFTNPVLYQDLADVDIMRNGDAFYYSASTMHFSPGAPILWSFDLVDWEYSSHSVPALDFGPQKDYNLSGTSAYNKGIYASFFNYNPKTKTWYWASAPEGPWKKSSTLNFCYYDCGMLIDDDGTIYVEGLRMYTRNGSYYILSVHPMDGNIILKGSSPWGPFQWKWLIHNAGSNLIQGFGPPAQGGLVSLADGRWYHMAFINGFPGGRIPVLAPVDWPSDGWPTVHTVNGAWSKQYPYPLTPHAVKSIVGTDNFASLGPQYEWNHNAGPSAWSITANGLELRTATVTDDFFMARNTLTHRILGPSSTATIKIDYSKMADGDRWVGVARDGSSFKVLMTNNISMNSNGWKTDNKGTQIASASISGGSIWLRTKVNVLPRAQQGTFQYSTDGVNFVNRWRYGVFNYATKAKGGSVTMRSFAIDGTMQNNPA
ncbi:glycosyl hydrolase [Clohesyomyces aquaticus]|uniref:Glycosyl hydrolase n=1 Tax=Clohesyomyces aquaticus TaxID=1231657 RepID=A0A1Y1ZQE6_9PLEO|nr:glycosyl hydrolase [Clohesyomyces aquaticus]